MVRILNVVDLQMYAVVVNDMQSLLPMIPLCVSQERCAVFDIDGTVLEMTGAVRDGMSIFGVCRRRNIPVHFVTARVDIKGVRELTVAQLRAAGILDYAGLHLFPATEERTTVNIARFKLRVRRSLSVGLNVGNAWSDVAVVDDAMDGVLDAVVGDNYFMHADATGVFHIKLPLRPRDSKF